MILVTKPYIPDFDKLSKLIKKANEKEWLTNFGPLHDELTTRLEEYLGVKNLLLVSNGTLALQIAYRALGLQDKVFTTPYSFLATSSSLVWEKIQPHYIDIDPNSLSMNSKLLPDNPERAISGIVDVHVYGNPAHVQELELYSKHNNLKTIYDGAHAFGIKKNGKSILTAGDATTLSLHATKVFHTVEGGAIIFKDKDKFEKAKELTNFGYNSSKDISDVGINCKLNEYQAAVGLILLDEIDLIIERRSAILQKYYDKLKDYVAIPTWDSEASKNGAYAPILCKDETELLSLMSHMSQAKIQTRRYFHPSLNTVPQYGHTVSRPVSENVASRVLALPIYTSMTADEQNYVIEHLLNFYKA